MEMKQFAKVFSELVADGLKETTKIIQTETIVKQEETAVKLSVTQLKEADTVKQEERAEKNMYYKDKTV